MTRPAADPEGAMTRVAETAEPKIPDWIPGWLRRGAIVDYHSLIHPLGPITQAGLTVREDPSQLRNGTWVVWLDGKAGAVHVDAVTLHVPAVLSADEKHIIRHSLGLDWAVHEYRNHYVVPEGTPAVELLEHLVEMGLMERGQGQTFNDPNRVYFVTPLGRHAVGAKGRKP